MASSNKSTKLQLNLWQGGDTPSRADFVYDNQQLESLVGAHLDDTNQHLTTAQRSYLRRPFYVYNYKGNGNATFNVNLGFSGPRALLVMCNHAPFEVDQQGKTHIYWDFYVKANSKTASCPSLNNSQGAIVESQFGPSYVTVKQGADANNENLVYHLNEADMIYTMIQLPTV